MFHSKTGNCVFCQNKISCFPPKQNKSCFLLKLENRVFRQNRKIVFFSAKTVNFIFSAKTRKLWFLVKTKKSWILVKTRKSCFPPKPRKPCFLAKLEIVISRQNKKNLALNKNGVSRFLSESENRIFCQNQKITFYAKIREIAFSKKLENHSVKSGE